MSAAGSGCLSQAGIVGIGIGAGSLFLIGASAIFIKIYLRRREHSRAVAEIERGFGRSSIRPSETAEVPNQKSPFRRNIVPSCDSGDGYNELSSNEQIHHIPKFASPKKAHPALLVEDEEARKGLVDAGKWSRLNRISSKHRRVQALSAIIESPRSNLTRSSVLPTALIRVEPPSRAQSDVIEEGIQLAGNGQDLSPERGSRSPSIAVPPRSALRPLTLTPSTFPLKENIKSRTVRSKSIGSYIGTLPHKTAANDASHHKRPGTHGRSLSFGAQVVGPAPSGPLPPLPSNAAILDQINQQLAVTLADIGKYNPNNSSPERNWESMVDRDFCDQEQRLKTLAETERRLERAASENQLEKPNGPRPLSLSPFRLSMRFSTDSAISKLTTISSIRTSLDNDFFNRLSIPVIETAEQLSVSRVPSSASLRSSGELKMVTTPKRRRLIGSRVSGSGSPAERRKALRAVSGNAMSPQRPISSMDKPSCIPLHFDKATFPAAKPSAMKGTGTKGSPGSRKGHRRQNFVRNSTLAPAVFGPARSSSGSSFSMDEICEAGENPPYADRHMNGDITLRPKSQHFDPSRPRSSLPWSKSAPLYSPHRPSCDSSPMSIPSFPSPTRDTSHRIHGCARNKITSTPPAMTFTRPSSEWNHNHESPLSSSPPFALHVTPSAPASNLYDPGYAAQSQRYDPTWPIISGLHDPPASGQEAEYDPGHDFALYSSPENSSTSSTNSLFDMSAKAIDDVSEPFSGLTIATPTPAGPREIFKLGPEEQADEPDLVSSAGTRSINALLPSSPQTQQPLPLSQETDKESSSSISPNSVHPFLAPAATLPSPLITAPLLKPTLQPSTFRSSLPRPAVYRRNSRRSSKTTTASAHPTGPQTQTQTSNQPPSSSGITKQKNTKSAMGTSKAYTGSKSRNGKGRISLLMGPRAPPPRDLRKSIIELRRENSELWFSSDDLDRIERLSGEESERRNGVNGCGSEVGYGAPGLCAQQEQEREREQEQQQNGRKKYLKLGRQASPVSPFLGFGDLSRVDSIADVPTTHHKNWNEEEEKKVQKQQTGSQRHVSGFDFGFDKSPFSRSMGQDVKQDSTMTKEGQVDDGFGDEEESDDPRASMIVEKEVSAYACGSSLFSPLHSAQGDERKGEDARKDRESGMGLTSPPGEGNATGTSVWGQGEKHWHQHQQSGSNDASFSTPNQSIRDTPRSPQVSWTGNEVREESDGTHSGKGKATPRSLYDEGGFLRNSPLRGRVARLGQVGIY